MGGCMGVGVVGGCPQHICTCMHTHTHTHTHVHIHIKHDNFNCKWQPPLGESLGQWVGSGQMIKKLINLELIEIIQFCLKIYDL